MVPSAGNPQAFNRYSYVTNNPLRYTDPTGHVRVEDAGGSHGSVNCSKYSQYCNNGKLKSSDELAKMRNQGKVNQPTLTATVPPLATAASTPVPTFTPGFNIGNVTLPAQCTNSSPCIGNYVTPTAYGTPTPFLYGPVNIAVALGGNVVSNVCGGPDLSGASSCGEVIDQTAQGLGPYNPLPPGIGTRIIDPILAGVSGANEIMNNVNNVHISEPTGQGYISGGIYLGAAEATTLFPLLIFTVLIP